MSYTVAHFKLSINAFKIKTKLLALSFTALFSLGCGLEIDSNQLYFDFSSFNLTGSFYLMLFLLILYFFTYFFDTHRYDREIFILENFFTRLSKEEKEMVVYKSTYFYEMKSILLFVRSLINGGLEEKRGKKIESLSDITYSFFECIFPLFLGFISLLSLLIRFVISLFF